MAVRIQHLAAVTGSAGIYALGLLGAPALGAAIDPATAGAAAELLKAVGGNLISVVSLAIWNRGCRRITERKPALDEDLLAALRRAVRASADDLEACWDKTKDAGRLRQRFPELAVVVESAFQGLRDADGPFSTDAAAIEADVRQLLGLAPEEAAAALADRVRAYVGIERSSEAHVVADFIAEQLPRRLAVGFAEELKKDDPANNRAWRAFQLMLAQDGHAIHDELRANQRASIELLRAFDARLDAWDRRLADAAHDPAVLRRHPDQQPLEQALDAAIARLGDEIRATLDAWGERIVDVVVAEGARILGAVDAGFEKLGDQISRLEVGHALVRDWVAPVAPRPDPDSLFLGRDDDLLQVAALLAPGARAAITAAVHGMPGVGKTTLARHLAASPADRFAGGVLFESLGATFRDPVLAEPILRRWAMYAYGRRDPPEGYQPSPEVVRTLLAGHGPILAVLDDVWDRHAIHPLLGALPPDAAVLITTRHEDLAVDLAARPYRLDVLDEPAAVELLRARARHARDHHLPILTDLATALGYHAQALDLAGRQLPNFPPLGWRAFADRIADHVRAGTVFDHLPVPDEQRERSVEVALAISNDDLPQLAQVHFRALGAFAPDATFRAEAVAGVWDCSDDDAWVQLATLADLGLLARLDDDEDDTRWRQHSLLRAYALALLRDAGEDAATRQRHATIHLTLMRDADDRQVYHELVPDHPQLLHAFDWAIAHDVHLALELAGNTANLQAAFGLARISHAWAERLLTAARAAGDDRLLAAALVTLANAFQRIATLPDEDRAARLREALAAYEAALVIYTPAAAPLGHAMTQNNRGAVLQDLATLPDEDRAARLREALRCGATAVGLFAELGHEPYLRVAVNALRETRRAAGPLFLGLWAELDVGDPPNWLMEDG